ncbi:MAG: PhzF family phenazine biosynthesis protein [Aestuariivirga sp.]|nr:PhzF family phenazine biosynthesis protein [Aestuariivirga sp.]
MPGLNYIHVDVFSRTSYSGNSLPVFPDAGGLSASQMLRITQELRHFEAVFLEPAAQANTVRARVFDLFEELPFAGHPIIGAAAVLHSRSGAIGAQSWQFDLPDKSVTISTEATGQGYFGLLDQGTPEFLGEVDAREAVATAFSLGPSDIRPDLPLEIVSTGLRYLIVPVQHGALTKARIPKDITDMLRGYGAQFAVLLDETSLEVRHWNNDGIVEDIATGSAAGTIGAYRLKHGLAKAGETFILNQGRFIGRPSQLRVRVEGDSRSIASVLVGGDVALVGSGRLDVRPV